MIQKQKKKTWAWFSKYMRLKHSDKKGMCECYTCGRKMKWNEKNCQAGHGIGGRTNNILFNEDIVRPQCYGCNVCGYGKLDEFGYKLSQEIGQDKYNDILKNKRKVKKYTEQELKEMEEFYKAQVKRLLKEKGLEEKPKIRKRYTKEAVIIAKLYPTRKRSKEVLEDLKNR